MKSARCLKAVTSKRATSQTKAQQCVKITDKKLKEPKGRESRRLENTFLPTSCLVSW